ncbi:MAG TPA: phenylalanine--tRNA ligase subunit alpha [Chitinophagales bacterium]|nr:phenylalanine--tRNA ligase subunit alpha [Chitinophagales bacterium]
MSQQPDIFSYMQTLLAQIEQETAGNADEVEKFRITYLGSKGIIKNLMASIKEVPNERKREFGQVANAVKQAAEDKWKTLKENAESQTATTAAQQQDLTRPALLHPLGGRHPLAVMRNEIIRIFERIGFVVAEGPEIEDDWHNFTALNTPDDHPSRDMQDTFYIQTNPNVLLRSQTSTVQVRVMENQKPPIRIISPGRVYRNETISARAHCQFHQVEGLYIDENVSFADLKQTLIYFARQLFGQDTQIRLRPSYFPFTEPSAEMDISCFICKGSGCNICKHSGWVEILGCGMVDPAVLEMSGIDSRRYTGFAFGMGIERITMLRYRINDIRLFFENDLRFLQQFRAAW